jgi:hypothetical protein
MVRDVIKNKKYKEFTVKLVLPTEKAAIELSSELLDMYDFEKTIIKKMEIGLGLKEMRISDVFCNVIIVYKFNTTKQAKEFEYLFSDVLNENNSNIKEALFVFESKKEEKKRDSTYEVKLNLPDVVKEIFALKEIVTASVFSYPNIVIDRDLHQWNKDKKNVLLIEEKFDDELIPLRLTKNGKIYTIPQKWLDIEDKAIHGVYNTKWVMDLSNFVEIRALSIISSYKGVEVEVSQDILRKDGNKSKFIRDGKNYLIDTISGEKVPAQVVILTPIA